jgi:hypothetical protein
VIPPCRYCDGEGETIKATELGPTELGPCPRCEGSQLDEAWGFTFTTERAGFAKVRIAYGAHAASRPLVDVELPTEAADLLSDVLGGRIRRGLILRDKR